MPIKVAIVGPESTGKSTITEQLALHFQAGFVPEFARSFMSNLHRTCTLADIETIAREQLKSESVDTPNLLFCDTNLLVTKIWAEHAFGSCPKFIADNWKASDYSLHLLMNVDLPWQPDPLREHPHLRAFFFDWYERELIHSKANYVVISGDANERLKRAIEAVKTILV